MDLPWALELLGVNQEAFRFGLGRVGQILNVLGNTYDYDFINNPLEACILSHDLY